MNALNKNYARDGKTKEVRLLNLKNLVSLKMFKPIIKRSYAANYQSSNKLLQYTYANNA